MTCDDGYPLAGTVFLPDTANGLGVVMAPATGVPCRFYFNFCLYLAGQGYTVLTWDWRGVGENAPDRLRGFAATALDWARLDLPAMLDWFYDEYGLPLVAIGHSFGGQVFGFYPRAERFEQLVLLASGTAWWRLWPAPGRYGFRLAVGMLIALTRLVGYLPGRRLGLGADLPRGVALQWFGWVSKRLYHGEWDGARAITAPVLSFGFSDDRLAPVEPRRWLLEQYGGTATFVTVAPKVAGVRHVGHLDFFRKRHADSLWPLLLERLTRG